MNFRKFLTTDWVTVFLDKSEEKGKQLGHKTNEKINHQTSKQKFYKSNKPEYNFKKKKRLSY